MLGLTFCVGVPLARRIAANVTTGGPCCRSSAPSTVRSLVGRGRSMEATCKPFGSANPGEARLCTSRRVNVGFWISR